MTIIGLKELRQNAGKIAERAQKGERFTVVKRSKPVFSIVPPEPQSNIEETREWTEAYVSKNQKAFDELSTK